MKIVGRRQYRSDVELLPGMTAKLASHTTTPAASKVKVTQGEEQPQGQKLGQMVLLKIEYEDGSVWKRDSK